MPGAGPTAQLCPCSSRHSPPITAAEIDEHHYPPKSWPLAPGGIRVVISVCVTTHRRCHRLHNLYVHHGGTPPAADLRAFRAIELQVGADAWANADHSGPNHLPYTLEPGDANHA